MLEVYGENAKDKFITLTFLSGVKQEICSDLLTNLENDILKGYNTFPDTIVEAYHMMAGFQAKRRKKLTYREALSASIVER